MVVIFCERSRYSAPLIRIPDSAPFPTPTISAAGVATPNAHGQAIIITATKASKPVTKSPITKYHNKNVATAAKTTEGTNFAAMESAIL